MTEKEYNERSGIRRSDLWRMNESPEKFLYFLKNPPETTLAMAFGTAAHMAMLEGKRFKEEYAVAPDADRRTKAGKEAWEKFTAENGGKTIISSADHDALCDMYSAMINCPTARKFLLEGDGKNEEAFFWEDPETGEKCKVKCDRVAEIDGKTWVIDYKTTASAQTEKFVHEMYRLGYHVQAAMYTEGVQIASGMKERPGFIFVAQEKKPPYSMNVIAVTDDVMNYGDIVYHGLLLKYHECSEMDDWPGYCDGDVNETFLPGWLEMGEEEE